MTKIVGTTKCDRKLSLANLVAANLNSLGYAASVLQNVTNSAGTHKDTCLVDSNLGRIHVTAQSQLKPNGFIDLDFGHDDQSFTVDKAFFAFGYNSTDNTGRTFVFMLNARHIVGKKKLLVSEMKQLAEKQPLSFIC